MSSVNADASIPERPILPDHTTSEDGWLKEGEWSAIIDRLNENSPQHSASSDGHRDSELVRCGDDPVQEQWLRRLDRLTPDPFKTIVRHQQEARERRALRRNGRRVGRNEMRVGKNGKLVGRKGRHVKKS
ncbi:hypothetical protein R3P38DRAFT_3245337 [Favolaschia claudopus]|uniref:Uncharacterized protein n=1 Tax=Favolaschia claudopus TaxID=2862362 RepID=A0AAV9Z2A6_9AGAR